MTPTDTAEALAPNATAQSFMASVWAIDCWPQGEGTPTAWDCRMMSERSADETSAAYLARACDY